MIAAALLALAANAQPGVPELPPRAPAEAAWLTWGNDWFGVPGARTDDHRTNEFALGLRCGAWVLDLDDSMLTLFDEGDRQRRHGVRQDELCATVGREVSTGCTVGLGLRWRGDAGGEGLQDWWHRTLGDSTVAATYEPEEGVALVGYGLWRHVFRGEEGFAPETLASALVTSDGEFAGDAAARLVWYTPDQIVVWAGLRYQVRAGDYATRVTDATAAYERGLCYEFGFSLGGALAFESRYILHDHAAVGALTFTRALP